MEFLLLRDDEVHKMVPQLGIAKKIIRLIPRDSTQVYQLCIVIIACISVYTTRHNYRTLNLLVA